MALRKDPWGKTPKDILQLDHPFPWTFDYESDESIEDEVTRAYQSEPVIRDANGTFVLDTKDLEDLGAYGRLCFAEWLVSCTQEPEGK
jgi:hypothetical protein